MNYGVFKDIPILVWSSKTSIFYLPQDGSTYIHTLHYIHYITLHYVTLRYITLHYITYIHTLITYIH